MVLLPRMSNFTDFNSLAAEPDVVVRYAETSSDLEGADVIVIPGSKNTIGDLEYLRQSGMAASVCRCAVRVEKSSVSAVGIRYWDGPLRTLTGWNLVAKLKGLGY